MSTENRVFERGDSLFGLEAQQQLSHWLEGQSAPEVIRWAVRTFGSGLVMTSSFGLNGVALIHMLHEITRGVPVVFVNTGFHFNETLEIKRQIQSTYGLEILTYHPSLSVEAQAHQYGTELYVKQPDLCCALRKIEPMQQAMADLKPIAVLNGRSRSQAHTRRSLSVVEWERSPLRVNPLAAWGQRQIRGYIEAHKIPYNPLHHKGYPSVGCRPCTRPLQVGEHIRSGRWPGFGKTECGLWSTNYAVGD